jgi:serine/threonine protein kinase
MQENWLIIQDIFNDALELPEAKRKAFVQRASKGDAEIEAAVWKQLEEFEKANLYFEDFEEQLVQSLENPLDAPPEIEDYKVLQTLGEGGMAKVYLAERNDGKLEQTLAIKVLKQGLSRNFYTRFEYEKRILASLKHPNLAQIYDAGLTSSGLPYFVMEYVEGLPLLDYCKKHHLSIKERLELFQQIGDVLQYAHQKLIIHRDLKPSNILVTDSGQVKLLDFGIAKVLDEQNPELTQTGNLLLTPNYASPEQLLGESIGTPSDVYQMGLVLYELLTGFRPREFGNQLSFFGNQMDSLISKTLYKTFSKQDAAIQEELAKERKLKLREFEKLLKGDLANIPMKCLELAPEDRYESIGQLKEDLHRYKAGLPLIAKKPSRAYLFRKFIQRNKAAVLFSIAIFFSLLTGIILTSWQAKIAAQNQLKAEKQSQRAERISNFLIKLFSSPDPRNPLGEGKDITLREFLDKRVDRLEEELSDEPDLQLELLGIVSDLYENMSYYKASKALEEKLAPRYKQNFGSKSEKYLESQLRIAMATHNLGAVAAADSMYQLLLEDFEAEQSLKYAKVLNDYGLFLQTAKGNFPMTDSILSLSEAIYIEAADTLNAGFAGLMSSKGLLKNILGQLPKAQEYYERELAIRKQISEEEVTIALAESNLSTVLQKLGALDEAKALQIKSLNVLQEVLGEDHTHSIHALNNLAVIYLRQFQYAQAEQAANQVLELYLEKLGASSYETAVAYLNTVAYLIRKKDYEAALQRVAKAKEILNPILPPQHYIHAVPLFAEALIYAKTNRGNPALEAAEKAKALLQLSIPPQHEYWGILYARQAAAYLSLKQLEQAKTAGEEAYNILAPRLGDEHYNTQNIIEIMEEIYRKLGNQQQAKAFADKLVKK